ncbi:hypothetical protein [Streptomyces sp. C]|uniref:WXG100 family type VII secretion target n=1 Tax=Streptomyces sp. C TaxID=253839 RepID=UPI0001DEF0F9|nr:hypothetical protein [Streptomyces sp. C]EFL15445.1 predicted protein [Streptomyces sp. C]
MATTNFEGYSHEQLLAMIASVNPETVKARATQLVEAAAVIKEIGSALKKHQVKGWEGEAAHAFQNWVSRAGSATLLLSDYSAAGGKWMTQAAQTMIEVKANTPKYDTSAAENLDAAHKFHNDPDAQQLGRTAYTKLTADHQQAVQQLTKLAQSYEQSSAEMNKATVPTFPAPPPDFVPPAGVEQGTYLARPTDGSASAASSGSGGGAFASPLSGPSNESSQVSGRLALRDDAVPPTTGLLPSPGLPDGGVDVGLDRVATLPDKTLPPATGLPVAPGPSSPGNGWTPPGVPVPPLPLPPSAGAVPPITRPPVGIGGKAGSIPVPTPRDTGIVGGRPIVSGGPSAGIPRGTVIGADGPHAGGRAVPGMMGGGFGSPHNSPGGSATGRRLAVELGGVVGGRQAAAGSQPFTQGGSGLVRGAGVGALGHGGTASPTPSRRRGGQMGDRPDYLAEDEETWQGNRRVVPPVID